jgi:hypothetical protein
MRVETTQNATAPTIQASTGRIRARSRRSNATLATASAMPTANWSRKAGSGSSQRAPLRPKPFGFVECKAKSCHATDAANRPASATSSLRTPPRGEMRRIASAHNGRKA